METINAYIVEKIIKIFSTKPTKRNVICKVFYNILCETLHCYQRLLSG